MSLFDELKRRNVFRVAAAYVIISWLIMQVGEVMAPALLLPGWVLSVLAFFLILGFPLAVFFAWAFEMTPDGIKREKDVDRSQSITHVTGRKLDRAIIGVLVIAVAMLLLDRFTGPSSDQPESGPGTVSVEMGPDPNLAESESVAVTEMRSDDKSVAVLPFVNMSDDAQNEYFSDGIAEELLNLLVRIEGLRVPSRTSSFTFKGSEMKLSDIGRELGVDHVLEGSVRKAGSRIRVTAQLIDVDSDTHLWSETYTRELDDIFAVQDEIAHAIVGALKITLSGEDERMLEQRPTDNIEAYNQYLFGRHWWNQRIPGRMAEAIPSLEKATELDPDFDAAWAALADVYMLLPEYGEGTVAEHIPKALEASERALAINANSAQALTSSAYIKAMHQYRWAEAEAQYIRAIELDPNYVTAYQWYAEMLAALRRPDDALAQLAIAERIDPLAPIVPHIQGWVSLWANRLDNAEQYYRTVFRLDPGFAYSISNLAQVHMMRGDYESARTLWGEFGELLDVDTSLYLLVIDAMEDPQLRQQAIEAVQQADFSRSPFDFPFLFCMLDRRDLALEWLLETFEGGMPYAPHINRMWIFEPLRDDPRFQALLAKMNLWP